MSNIYIGDRPLDPPEDDECETCGGTGIEHGRSSHNFGCEGPCSECCRGHDQDPGEPDDYPEPDL